VKDLAGDRAIVDVHPQPARRRQVVGSRETALETVIVLRQVVSRARFSNIDQLVAIIKSVGRKLVDAQPKGALVHLPCV
jgi:translation initiation factor eIF-2B subunit beta